MPTTDHVHGCHCGGPECAPCRHHPGVDCDCYCRFCVACGPDCEDVPSDPFWARPKNEQESPS